MAKKPTASQLARKAKQKQKKLLQSVERRERKAVLKNNRREALAEKWHTTAAHEIGHAIVVALVGLPVKDVSCRVYGTFAGATTYATERKAYASIASTLPPSYGFLQMFAGKAATLAAGFSEDESEEGLGSDVKGAEHTYLLCLAYTPVTNKREHTSSFNDPEVIYSPSKIDFTQDPHKQRFAYVRKRSVAVVKAILEQERVAFTQLVDELRFSQKVRPPHTGAPSGYLRGRRIAEVLFEKGTNVNGARDTLIAEAKAIDEHIGTKPFFSVNMPQSKKGLGGYPSVVYPDRAQEKRDEINLAARLRRAKKKR